METHSNCMDCPHHKVEADPDPHDWFYDDDQAVLCKLSENVENKKRWLDGSVWEFRPVTCSCRRHQKEEEIAKANGTYKKPRWR